MKVNPSPGPRKQPVFSPKRPVAAFLVMTAALSFTLLFASVGQTYAASLASASEIAKAYDAIGNVATSTPPRWASLSPAQRVAAFLPYQHRFLSRPQYIMSSVLCPLLSL